MASGILRLLIGICLFVPSASMYIDFQQQCGGYLKQAADANTVELAQERLNLAVKYIEAKGYTQGYTSVFVKTEDENIGYWYQNIKACQHELDSALNGSQLEKSNVLMKVRESLTDNGEKGTELTIPSGLYAYPHNLLLGIIEWIALLLVISGGMKIYNESV
jgi:hypothetical protein